MRKTRIIILTVAAALLIAGLILGFSFTRFDETLQAVKLDPDGKQIGTVHIRMKGVKSNFFGNKKLHGLSIDGFDGISNISDLDVSKFPKDPIYGYWSMTFGVGNLSMNQTDLGSAVASGYTCDIAFSNDLEYWRICIRQGKDPGVSYLFSLSGKSTVDELIQNFQDCFQ